MNNVHTMDMTTVAHELNIAVPKMRDALDKAQKEFEEDELMTDFVATLDKYEKDLNKRAQWLLDNPNATLEEIVGWNPKKKSQIQKNLKIIKNINNVT